MASRASASPKHGNNVPALSEDTVRELLALQRQELAFKLNVVERDREEIGLNKSLVQQSIEAQERDRRHEREEVTKRQRTHQNFILLATLGLLAFSAWAMHVGKEDIVLDLVKVVAGFAGGMGYQAIRNAKRKTNNE